MNRRQVIRVLVTVVSLVVIVGLSGSLVDLWKRRDIVSEQKSELQKAERQNARLKESLQEATTAAFVEKVAREKLGMAKEGESVVLIPRDFQELLSGDKPQVKTVEPNWKQWLRLFF